MAMCTWIHSEDLNFCMCVCELTCNIIKLQREITPHDFSHCRDQTVSAKYSTNTICAINYSPLRSLLHNPYYVIIKCNLYLTNSKHLWQLWLSAAARKEEQTNTDSPLGAAHYHDSLAQSSSTGVAQGLRINLKQYLFTTPTIQCRFSLLVWTSLRSRLSYSTCNGPQRRRYTQKLSKIQNSKL